MKRGASTRMHQTAPSAKSANDGPTPNQMRQHKCRNPGHNRRRHRTRQQRQPKIAGLPQQPLQRGFKMPIHRRSTQQPGAEPIIHKRNGRKGQRVGNPNHGDSHRQIEPQPNRCDRSQDHLPWHRHECEEGAGCQSSNSGPPAKMPESWIVEMITQKPQRFMSA